MVIIHLYIEIMTQQETKRKWMEERQRVTGERGEIERERETERRGWGDRYNRQTEGGERETAILRRMKESRGGKGETHKAPGHKENSGKT